jgi:hypothetical protein
MEAEAFAVQCAVDKGMNDPSLAASDLAGAASALSSWPYFWAASSPAMAQAAIATATTNLCADDLTRIAEATKPWNP